jgi:MoaA/NifB/PqqE/SkfB family radical SAM enzyme
METWPKVARIPSIQAVKAILRILPRISEDQLLRFPIVRRNLESISHYPEATDFLKSLLIQVRRNIGRLSKNCLAHFAGNLLFNEFIAGRRKREEFFARYRFHPPYFLVLSPTMRCNLKCYGCYADGYGKDEELDTGEVHRLLEEAKGMGIYFITISGGEPFIRPDLLDIFATHKDIFFQVFTNGTLIDERMAGTLAELGNVLPAFSVEGWEKETDARRGPGVFQKILAAMARLKEEGVPFGYSATATRQNNELIISDEFVNFLAEQGCFVGWYFNYIPIGKKPTLELMPTPEQRIHRLKRLRELRKKSSILLADFFSDGPMVGGCIAGDRYLHINCRGDVEPCVFIHFSVDNVRRKTLAEILDSEFFHAIRRRQPYSFNCYRPCLITDHPQILRQVIGEHRAYPTHPDAEDILHAFSADLDRYAQAYGEMADALWREQTLSSKDFPFPGLARR